MTLSSRQILLNAFYVIAQGKVYQHRSDNPAALQNALHKTLKRYKWKGYRVSKDSEFVYITRK